MTQQLLCKMTCSSFEYLWASRCSSCSCLAHHVASGDRTCTRCRAAKQYTDLTYTSAWCRQSVGIGSGDKPSDIIAQAPTLSITCHSKTLLTSVSTVDKVLSKQPTSAISAASDNSSCRKTCSSCFLSSATLFTCVRPNITLASTHKPTSLPMPV